MPPSVPVPFPDSTFPGTHSQESGGRIINSYVEPLGASAPTQIIYRRGPGLRNFGVTTRTNFRGAIEVDGVLYCAFTNRAVMISTVGGIATDLGALLGAVKGFWARNTRSAAGAPADNFPGVVFVDPDGHYASVDTKGKTISTTLPAGFGGKSPNSVCVVDNYFFYTFGAGEVWASDLNSTNITATSFATAESKPDGLIRGVGWAGQLFLFGPSTCEVWVNAGTVPFPFQRSVVIPRGLAGPFCVSGFEDNFSRGLVWVADDNTVVRLNGYNPEKISPPDLDGLIERVIDKRQLEMSSFISRGHAFLLLSSPTWSWVFDMNTNKWGERNSYLLPRSRITGSTFAFGKWLCGDRLTGNILEITNATHTEAAYTQQITAIPTALLNIYAADTVTVVDGGVGYEVGDEIVLSESGVQVIVTTLVGSLAQPRAIATVVPNAEHRGELVSETTPPVTAATQILTNGMGSGATFNIATWEAVGTVPGATIKLVVPRAKGFHDEVVVAGVLGTVEANGRWKINVLDDTHIELIGSLFVNAYTSGGTVTDTFKPPFRWRLESGAVENFPVGSRVGRLDCEFVTGVGSAPGLDPIETDPVVEISWSDDGGQTYSAPIRRKLGRQALTRELVSLIACTGRSSWNARRWRLDISDPVYVGFMGAWQNTSPKVSDIG